MPLPVVSGKERWREDRSAIVSRQLHPLRRLAPHILIQGDGTLALKFCGLDHLSEMHLGCLPRCQLYEIGHPQDRNSPGPLRQQRQKLGLIPMPGPARPSHLSCFGWNPATLSAADLKFELPPASSNTRANCVAPCPGTSLTAAQLATFWTLLRGSEIAPG